MPKSRDVSMIGVLVYWEPRFVQIPNKLDTNVILHLCASIGGC